MKGATRMPSDVRTVWNPSESCRANSLKTLDRAASLRAEYRGCGNDLWAASDWRVVSDDSGVSSVRVSEVAVARPGFSSEGLDGVQAV